MKTANALTLLLVALSFFISACFYAALPANVAIHWNIYGGPDGYAPKEIALLFLPALIAIIIPLLFFAPKIDPLKKNTEKFRGQYELFIVSLAAFFLYVHTITLLINAGWGIDLMRAMSLGFAFLFYSLGSLVGAAKRNYFIGIRTPWTLDSEEVWSKTHRLGRKLFKGCAAIALAGALLPGGFSLLASIGAIIAAAIFLAWYSYREHAKIKALKKRNKKK